MSLRSLRTCVHLAVALLGVSFASPAFGQANADLTQRINRQLQQFERQYSLQPSPVLSIGERAMLDYGAQVTYSFLAVDDVDQKTRILRRFDSQLFGYLNLDGVHELYGRLRFTYDDYNSGDSFDGGGDQFEYPVGDRWWYRFDLRRAIEAYKGEISPNNVNVQIGRQYVDWGSGIAFSDELYAVRLNAEIGNYINLQGLVGSTPRSSVVDFDSSRPSFDGDTNRLFVGGMAQWVPWDIFKPYVFYLRQWDNNDEDFTMVDMPPPGPGPEDDSLAFDYNSTYWAVGAEGRLMPRLTYEAEGILETGEGLSNSYNQLTGSVLGSPQTMEDIEAWAARGQLTYSFLDENRSRIDFESILASGDDDRHLDTSNTFGGNLTGTDDRSFNAFGYGNTGLAFAAPISNLMMFRLGGTTFPFRSAQGNLLRRLQIGADGFIFNKMDPDAPSDELTSNDRFLGWELDAYCNWRITSDFAVFIRYGIFFPGTAIIGDDDARNFFYTGFTYSF